MTFVRQDVDVKRQGAVTAYAFIQFTDISSVVRALKDLDGTSWGSTKLKVFVLPLAATYGNVIVRRCHQ